MCSTKRARISKPTLEESSRPRLSAQVIASNDDLLSELLLRLPIKSLLKFKSVSKHWLTLITDPHFTSSNYLKYSTVSALYLYCPSSLTGLYYDFVALDPSQKSAQFVSFTFVKHRRGIEILHSCNGLFCCSGFVSRGSKRKYYIYNPSTKQFKTLPPVLPTSAWVPVFNLAFDPSKSHFYKVVRIQRGGNPYFDNYHILIYSSETEQWRVSGAPLHAPLTVEFRSGVYWNGAMHWVNKKGPSLYFDLDKELVREMPMPPPPGHLIRYFGESCGRLYLVFICDVSQTIFDVYKMERDHSSWILKFRFDLDRVVGILPNTLKSSENGFPFLLLCVVGGGEEEDSFLVLHIPGKVVRYNFRSKTHLEIWNTDSRKRYHPHQAFQYIENISLV